MLKKISDNNVKTLEEKYNNFISNLIEQQKDEILKMNKIFDEKLKKKDIQIEVYISIILFYFLK